MKQSGSILVLFIIAILLSGSTLSAQRYRSSAQTNVNRNLNVNRNANVNVNRNVSVNANNNYYRGSYYGGGCCYHPVATAAAVTATAVVTAAVVGSIVNSVPPSCTSVIVNGLALPTVRQHLVPSSILGNVDNLYRSKSATMTSRREKRTSLWLDEQTSLRKKWGDQP
jgi:hypothetical protein